ncbi:hypothetical protein VN12_10375 [Pirellula sp. SH-Sr6A]|uniref:hypothetical protein n=1 Tax=Pirellula sp. SH-Sr6A TaxID=1632865 RepID=UPI00078C192E|nr:hypothetical protein [Pirellula sp. SH-Sr6A]AMV32520.1 hypothetical protein VN12_10375 [Pirellula sp. SH-Sr6A]
MSVATSPFTFSADSLVPATDCDKACPLSPPGDLLPAEVELRSERFAFALSDEFPVPSDIAMAFLNPIAGEERESTQYATTEAISELLNPRSLHSSVSPIRLEHHQRLVSGLARCWNWIYHRAPWEHDTWRAQSALQAMLPLYCIQKNESWEHHLSHSLQLLRRHAVLILWEESLQSAGIQSWLRRPDFGSESLALRIENAFHLCINHLSHCYWLELASQTQHALLPVTSTRSCEWETETWQLASTLLREEALVDATELSGNSALSAVDMREHWKRLTRTLAESKPRTRANGGSQPEAIAEDETQSSISRSIDRDPAPYLQKIVPISDRNARDLTSKLRDLLQSSEKECVISLAVLRAIPNPSSKSTGHPDEAPDCIPELCDDDIATVEAMFRTEQNDWVFVYSGLDRSELARRIREAFEQRKAAPSRDGKSLLSHYFVAGVSTVIDPTASFEVTSLIEGAWRCLDAAEVQGSNAVKTIEVF